MKTVDEQVWAMNKAELFGQLSRCAMKGVMENVHSDKLLDTSTAELLMRNIILLEYRMGLAGFRFADDMRNHVSVYGRNNATIECGLFVFDNRSITLVIECRGEQCRYSVVDGEHASNARTLDWVSAPMLTTDNLTDFTRLVILEASKESQRIKNLTAQAVEIAILLQRR